MFLAKKIISQFFMPVSLSLEITIVGLFLLYATSKQRAGRFLVLTGTVLLAFCSFTPTTDFLINPLIKQFKPYEQNMELLQNRKAGTVVVLGAGHDSYSDIPLTSRIGYDSLVRLVEGIRIYRTMPEGKLLLSGGSKPGTISSAQDMAQLAEELGVNKKDIIIESVSRDTDDEARIIRSMLGKESIVLVTSSSHMPRSMLLFRKYDMNPVPAPTRSIEEKLLYREPDTFFPSSVNLEKSETAFHEYLGIVWAKLR